jgi:transcriptional regulator with GAF, ATPase, and Fis domain
MKEAEGSQCHGRIAIREPIPTQHPMRWVCACVRQGSEMQTLERIIAHVAATNFAILLIAESATGSQFIAHQVHRLSSRSNEPPVRAI